MVCVYFSLFLLVSSSQLYSKYDEAIIIPAAHISSRQSPSNAERDRLRHGSDLRTETIETSLSPKEILSEIPVKRYKRNANGVKYTSIDQEVNAAGSMVGDDESRKKKPSSKQNSSLLYSKGSAAEDAEATMVGDSVNIENTQENPVDRFFKKGLWVDSSFRRSLLNEYQDFFEKELQSKTFIKKVITIQSSKFKKALVDFKAVYGSDFEKEFNPYVTMINEIVIHMNPSLSTKLKRDRIKPIGLTIGSVPGSNNSLYRLTYEGYLGGDILVTEKSMHLLFGDERVAQLKKDKKATLFVPYKNGLDMLAKGTRVFSVSLLREKSRCVK